MQISFICCAAAFGGWLQDNIGSLKTPLLGFQAALNRHTPRSLAKYCTRISWRCAGSWGRLWQANPAATVCGHRLRGVAASVQS